MKRFAVTLIVLFSLSLIGAIANKTSVEIKAPAEVKAGTEVTIVINVAHKGNSKMHYTDWVYLKINGKEVQRWEYNKNKLPLTENFTIEYKLLVNEEINIEAEGHCNIHGSAGKQTAVIKLIQ